MDTLESLRDRVEELEAQAQRLVEGKCALTQRAEAAEAKLAGLLEAVGPLAEYIRHALEMRGNETPRPFPAKDARAFLEAYDAAK